MNKKYLLLLAFSLIFSLTNIFASGIYGAYISAKHISGYTYEIKVVTYTTPSSSSNIPEIPVSFGDGDTGIFYNNGIGSGGSTPSGFLISVYTGTHTYSGTGIFTISLELLGNRNAGIVNIPNSINTSFFVYTNLYVFNPAIECISNSIDFGTIPITELFSNSYYKTDVPLSFSDGDSLTYSLAACRGLGGNVVPGYDFNGATIDTATGIFELGGSVLTGEFDFVVKVEKWRQGTLVGLSTFDFLIKVSSDTITSFFINSNSPCTIINDSTYHCDINPGNTLTINQTYSNDIEVEWMSETLDPANSNPAITNTTVGSSIFTWTPNINDARYFYYPYKTTFRASQTQNQGSITVSKDIVYFIYVSDTSTTIDCPTPTALNLKKLSKENLLSIYPNPNNGIFTLTMEKSETGTISISDILGRKIEIIQILKSQNMQIDLSQYAQGIYHVQIITPSTSDTKRIIIE